MSYIEETIQMPTARYRLAATNATAPHPVSHYKLNRPHHHTHVQQVAGCIHV